MEVVADTGWFECGTDLDRLMEQEEDDACFGQMMNLNVILLSTD